MGTLYDEALVIVHGVWRRRWLALGVGWGVALIGWLIVSLIPNTYKSQARIYIEAQSLLTDKVGISQGERAASLETVRQTLTSAANLEQVVRGTDLAKHLSSDSAVAAKAAGLQKSIEVTAKQDNLFEISAAVHESGLSDGENARLSKEIVTKLIDLFVGGNMQGGREETGQSLKFLDAQIASRSGQLAQAEAKRAAFEAKYLSGLPGSGSIADRIGQARGELSRLDSDYAAAQSGLAAVNGQLAGTPASTRTPGVMMPGSPGAVDGRASVIEGQIADGQARGWTDQHPDMVALRNQLGRIRSQGGSRGGGTAARMSAGSNAPNPMYMSLRSMQAERAATASAIGARKSQIEGEINRVLTLQSSDPEFASQQTSLDRDYQALKVQYDKLLADREDLRLRGQVQSQTDAVKVSVIDPPSVPSVPATPNRPLLLTLVLLAAIAAGIGTAFAQSQLKSTYATPARLERASGLPVIGTISEVIRPAARPLRRQRLIQFAGGAGALVGVWVLLMVVEFVGRSFVA